MKLLTILVPDGAHNLSSVVGSFKILSRANEYQKNLGRSEIFKIQLAGVSKTVTLYDGLFTIRPHVHISDVRKTNLIIIPSLNHNFSESVAQNKKMANWILQQHNRGAEVASICTGAFLLASTGLLDGKSCSTHWSAARRLGEMFPKVNWVNDHFITDEDGIYTNGGAFSFLNLLLYLIEKYYDRETAIYCAKVFQIDIDRNSQSQFTIFTGQKNHGDEVIKKAQGLIEKNINDKISIESLATGFAVSRRNFDRRFIKATGNTPLEYLQRVKIEAAKKYLETGRKTINEVMFDVGYSDVKAFRELFRRITGLSPLEYRNKYNREFVSN
ncbi:MAG TPA: helix-turn-helix domain-containing protein [Cyclobacteriaceae bacterium]|nr:helix-turn-helix domain-containing protein [Cyclobacteriaceae bacterium]